MTLLMWLMLVFLLLCTMLCVILIIAFIRLGRELRRMGDDTATLLQRASRTIKTVQFFVPLLLAVQKRGRAVIRKRSTKKG